MGDVLHLHDAHEQTQSLLPWRVNGTLEPGEAALVDAHVEQCEECRADLAANLALRAQYANMSALSPPLPERRPAAMLPGSRLRLFRRRVSIGWALAGQAAVAAAAALVLFVGQSPADRQDEYRLLGADAAEQRGNAIVLFSPDTTERDLRASLRDAGAQVVGGPTVSGAFLVRVDHEERAIALGKLRADEHVLLAEPLDPAGGE